MNEKTPSLTQLFELAHGGIGTVSLAVRREGRFSRVYAVKRLHPHLRRDPTFCEMFLEEARIAGQLRHANIAGVLDIGDDEEGPFFVMEYVEGLSLRDLLIASRASALLPLQLGLAIGEQAARGLHVAHEATNAAGDALHLVHRDVSPHNLLVGYDGTVRVADFGIAKVRDSDQRTSTGVLKGKMGYMSPEQLRFERIDHRSDLFSLGVTLYETFSAARLYGPPKDPTSQGGRTAPHRILNEEPPELSSVRRDVPPALEELLLEMLAKDPVHRPQSANEVAERLAAILHEVAVDEGPLSIAAYLEENFSARRAEHAKRVLSAQNQQTIVTPDAALVATETPSPKAAPAAHSSPRGRSSLRWFVAALLLAVGAGAGLFAIADSTSSTETDAAEESSTSKPLVEAAVVPMPVPVESPIEAAPTLPEPAEAAPNEQVPSKRRRRRRQPTNEEDMATPAITAPTMSEQAPDGWWTD